MDGYETEINIVNWRSTKAPRASLGSNGSEVQSITGGEDWNYLIRLFWAEINGIKIERYKWDEIVKNYTKGCLIMDSKGIYDAATRNESPLHGLRSSRAGYELVSAVKQAKKVGTALRWVHGGAQLADPLTKSGTQARNTFTMFYRQGQRWRLVYDDKYESARRRTKKGLKALQDDIDDRELKFLEVIAHFSIDEGYHNDETPEDELPEGLMQLRQQRDLG